MTPVERFTTVFGASPTVVARAPGRINLIGEHTDYNDGFVLPCAVDLSVTVATRPNTHGTINAHAALFNESRTVALDKLRPSPEAGWMNYVSGVAHELGVRGIPLTGADLLIDGNVPLGAGLSSSAAIEVATAMALLALAHSTLPGTEIALACQRAEHTFAGVQCGIMDQFISALGQKDHALFLDCRSLAYELVPIPTNARIVICDTTVSRELAVSGYNARRQSCERGVSIIQRKFPEVRALRDVTSVMIEDFRSHLEPEVFRRCHHVVTENERVLQSVRALRNGDLSEFGKLMYQSHLSLRRDYEVSCPELDAVVDICAEEEEVFGARMTGAGFGGCAICLVREDHVAHLMNRLSEEFPAKTGRTPRLYSCSIEDGARTKEIG